MANKKVSNVYLPAHRAHWQGEIGYEQPSQEVGCKVYSDKIPTLIADVYLQSQQTCPDGYEPLVVH